MSRTAKIAAVAAVAGMMLAVGIATLREPRNILSEAALPISDESGANIPLARELERCATLTMPDSGCEAAWATNRRRFFRQEKRETSEELGSNVPPVDLEGLKP
ncbi:MAG: hypothetical protein E2598_07955 [Sphingobium sp.]|nr:hypothetical protein [Sphingobium sp.]